MENDISTEISEVANLIAGADSILFITGAGISADSGLPTYRGLGGLYNGSVTEEGFTIEEALSSNVMSKRPDITWKYLWQIGSACLKAKPNRAHKIISLIQEFKPDSWVLTQNIDGLHRAAGNKNLIEIHGNAFDLYCTQCGYKPDIDALFPVSGQKPELPPKCAKCTGIVRPNVVLFGEMLPEECLAQYYKVLSSNPELIISIGTSGMFQYITGPVYDAIHQGRKTVEINPAESNFSGMVNYYLPLTAARAMEKIWEKLKLHFV